ncbi:MAG TPA: hypothetical protein PKY96_16040, partial [Flavobacteriales bacterium]|nr:hypothetical protein [Flavobacteriales bacterium]
MRYLTLLLAALLINACAQAQGCSDAGVCTAGPLGQVAAQGDSTTKALRHFARLQFSYAVGEQGVAISQAVPEISLGITERWSVQARIPFMLISGNLGQNEGVGDPVITSSYAIMNRDSLRLESLIGVKLPANAADARDAGDRPLPMPYQTSLGTTDLLAGISFRSKRLTIALAYQHVLNDGNEN